MNGSRDSEMAPYQLCSSLLGLFNVSSIIKLEGPRRLGRAVNDQVPFSLPRKGPLFKTRSWKYHRNPNNPMHAFVFNGNLRVHVLP